MVKKREGSQEALLRSMLGVLLEAWGFEAVRNQLEDLHAQKCPELSLGLSEDTASAEARRAGPNSKKPTAVMLAEKVSLPPMQKQLIQQLALGFDEKRFLPTTGDIRYFFEVYGDEMPPTKQRSEMFRRVLRLLSTLNDSALRQMVENENHNGPSTLAPLSAAMRNAGLQRSREDVQAPQSSIDGPLREEKLSDSED